MTNFIECLKRLYMDDKISKEKLLSLLDEKKINQEQFDYITIK